MVAGPTAFTVRDVEVTFKPTPTVFVPFTLKSATSVWNLAVAERDARALMRHYLGPEHDWTLKFRQISGVAGRCDYGPKRLLFSKSWTLELGREEFHQTVLHEIGHALAGHDHGHDMVWADIVRAMGGIPNEKVDTEPHEYNKANVFKWTVTCPCGKIKMYRAKKTEKLARSVCRTCRERVILTQNF